MSDEASTNFPFPSSSTLESEIPESGSSSLKRKSNSSLDSSSSKKRAVASSIPRAPRSKKRVVIGTRKERKKEQNKTAALRYRQKKKEEKYDVDEQLSILEEKNTLLKTTLGSLDAEVNYLKRLWDEVVQARGT